MKRVAVCRRSDRCTVRSTELQDNVVPTPVVFSRIIYVMAILQIKFSR